MVPTSVPGGSRPRRSSLLVLCSLALPLLPLRSEAQAAGDAALQVQVYSVAGEPLEGVAVSIPGTSWAGRSDARGRVRLAPLPAGIYFVQVRRLGYRAEGFRAELEAGWLREWEIRLEPEPIPVAEVRVVAEEAEVGRMDFLRGFYERRDRGRGYFLTREEIVNHGSRDLGNLLRTVPGLHTTPSQFGRTTMSTRGSNQYLAGRCDVRAYVDGVIYREASDLPGIPTLDIEAIEVYRGRAELPAEFADVGANCGVVVIWTRRHRPDAGR